MNDVRNMHVFSSVFMRGQTKISPNGSIFNPEYSGTSCFFIKFKCDDKIDTFVETFGDCDGQEIGA
jgi:hypothetical protein